MMSVATMISVSPRYICVVQVLEHMSGTIFKSNEIGEEFFRIGLTHLMSFKENR